MRIAFTHNLRLTDSEEEAEFDTGETVDDSLTKAEASKQIEELRKESPRLAGRD